METPTSMKRITRSQAKAAMHSASKNSVLVSSKIENSEQAITKSMKRNRKQSQDSRSALVDISNDSPIVGVAMGSLETPSSATTGKHRNNSRIKNNTPGSGETLLRGQVKTLLQMVEEEAVVSKFPVENCPIIRLQGFLNSPSVLAPTPANTPQIPNLSENSNIMNNGFGSFIASPTVEELVKITEETESPGITRSLLLDFYEKSESPDASDCSSVLTYQGVITGPNGLKEKSSEDEDSASVWSIQVNASTTTHDEDEEEVFEEEEEEEAECEGGDGEGGGVLLDELCEGISEMKIMSKFNGKRIKFVYNSEDEMVEEEEETTGASDVLRLKGWPTPKGKHSRFVADEEADD